MKNHRKIKKALKYSILLYVLSVAGCRKLVEVPPPVTSVSSENVFSDNQTAAAVLTGIYTNISNNGVAAGVSAITLTGGLSSDELGLFSGTYSTDYLQYYQNALNSNTGLSLWTNIYPIVYVANTAIAGLTNNSALTPAVDKQLLGEALFMRAFCYFYLVNLYGDVPLVTGTNYKTNEILGRTPAKQVYAQIIADLTGAQNLLSDQFLDGTVLNSSADRVRPSKWAATALLARVYLYYDNLTGAGDYTNAITQASAVISSTSLFSLSGLSNTFLKASDGNNEAIWQLQPVLAGQNTSDALLFVLPSSGPNNGQNPVYLNNDLVNSFEPGDQRFTSWVSSVTDTINGNPTTFYFAYKYKIIDPSAAVDEYEMVLRLGEQYLIRAEAEAENGDIGAAQADLNIIRARAGLPNATANTKSALLTAVAHERRVELFTEWGHRWLDLKRTAKADSVMTIITPKKGSVWKSYQRLYPLPLSDLQTDPKLVQNPGY